MTCTHSCRRQLHNALACTFNDSPPVGIPLSANRSPPPVNRPVQTLRPPLAPPSGYPPPDPGQPRTPEHLASRASVVLLPALLGDRPSFIATADRRSGPPGSSRAAPSPPYDRSPRAAGSPAPASTWWERSVGGRLVHSSRSVPCASATDLPAGAGRRTARQRPVGQFGVPVSSSVGDRARRPGPLPVPGLVRVPSAGHQVGDGQPSGATGDCGSNPRTLATCLVSIL